MCNPMAGFPPCTGQEALDYASGRKVPPWLQPDAGKADGQKETPKPKRPAPEPDMGPNPGIPGGIPRVVSGYVELPVAWMDSTSHAGKGPSLATPEVSGGLPSPRPAADRPSFLPPPQPMPPAPGELPSPVRKPKSLWEGSEGRGHMNFRWSLFARAVCNTTERFSDAVVAAAAHDVREAGKVAEKVAVPMIVATALVFGAIKMVETGDTSTFQRAWAMLR